MIHVPLRDFYPVSPPQPIWLHSKYQRINEMRQKKLAMNDQQIAELFKSIFGIKKALTNKVSMNFSNIFKMLSTFQISL